LPPIKLNPISCPSHVCIPATSCAGEKHSSAGWSHAKPWSF
jgi:hypothetical protein